MNRTLNAMAAATANAAEVKKPKTLCTRTSVECMIVVFRGSKATFSKFPLEHSLLVVLTDQVAGRGEVVTLAGLAGRPPSRGRRAGKQQHMLGACRPAR
jgi:hypothetical protein